MHEYCLTLVRNNAPDLYLMALSAPVQARPKLIAIYAFIAEIRNIRHVVREVMLGHIRFAWWREALEEIYTGKQARKNPILEELAVIIPKYRLPREDFEAVLAEEEAKMERSPHGAEQARPSHAVAAAKAGEGQAVKGEDDALPPALRASLRLLSATSPQGGSGDLERWQKKAKMIQKHYAPQLASGRRLRKSPWLTLKLLLS